MSENYDTIVGVLGEDGCWALDNETGSIKAWNQGGYDFVDIDAKMLARWLVEHHPELFDERRTIQQMVRHKL